MEEPTLVLAMHFDSVETEIILNHIKNNTLKLYLSRYRSSHLVSIIIFNFDIWTSVQKEIQQALTDVFLGSNHYVKFIYGVKSLWSKLSTYIEKDYTVRVISNQINIIPKAVKTKVVDNSHGHVKIIKLDKLKGYVDRVPTKLKFVSLESQVARCKVMMDKDDILPSTWSVDKLGISRRSEEFQWDNTYSTGATDGISSLGDMRTEFEGGDQRLSFERVASGNFRLNAYIRMGDRIIYDYIVHDKIVERKLSKNEIVEFISKIIKDCIENQSFSDGEMAILKNKGVLIDMVYGVLGYLKLTLENDSNELEFSQNGIDYFKIYHETPQYYRNIISQINSEHSSK